MTTEEAIAVRWRSIRSAPKDGTVVLIYDPSENEGRRIKAAYWDAEFDWIGWSDKFNKARYRGAWTDNAVASFAYEETVEYKPTHWMPLPAAPKPTTAKGV